MSAGVSAIRADVARLNERVGELTVQLEQTREAQRAPETEPAPPTPGRHAYRSLFARTEPSEKTGAESTAEQSA